MHSNQTDEIPTIAGDMASDKLEESLVRAHGFLEEALKVRRETRSVTDGHRIEYHPRGWRDVARRMLQKVNREYVLVSSGFSVCNPEHLDSQQQTVRKLVDQGVRVRHLFTPRALGHGTVHHYADTVRGHGAEVRVSNRHIHDAIIVDGLAAVIWGRSAFYGEQCLSIKGTVMLESLCRSLGVVWDVSPPLATHQRWFGTEGGKLTRDIVALLHAGYKDETAARQLGMSVRTFRRRVAEILEQLDAESRFQAGAKAVQLGLIPSL